MLSAVFEDTAAWVSEAWDAVADCAEAILEAMATALCAAMAVWILLHLGPILLVWLAGAPLWVVMALLFGF